MEKKLLVFGTAFIILGVLALIFSGLSYAVLHGTNDAPLGFYHLWNVMLKISVPIGAILCAAGVFLLIILLIIRARP